MITVRHNNEWVKGSPIVYHNGKWQNGKAWVFHNGEWHLRKEYQDYTYFLIKTTSIPTHSYVSGYNHYTLDERASWVNENISGYITGIHFKNLVSASSPDTDVRQEFYLHLRSDIEHSERLKIMDQLQDKSLKLIISDDNGSLHTFSPTSVAFFNSQVVLRCGTSLGSEDALRINELFSKWNSLVRPTGKPLIFSSTKGVSHKIKT